MYLLYDYFRSTASYRVRIVLEHKKISYKKKEIHLVQNGGEQNGSNYTAINPQKLVPCLRHIDSNLTINQSLAIIDYLEAQYPEPTIYSTSAILNAQIKSVALQICCDIHPLNNLRVLTYLQNTLSVSPDQKSDWYHHWLYEGFTALETQLSSVKRNKLFCFSDKLTLADVCLIPQIYNAKRFEFDLKAFPLLSDINEYCLTLCAFKNAAP
jgi:maleylacetoacetate isomerase